MPSCLFCAETIEKGTKKCPHCGESLDTQRTSVGLARWRGDALLVMADGGSVPARGCAICAAPESSRCERKFVYTPPWVYIGLLGGLLPLLLLMVIGQKRAKVWVPLCDACLNRWRLGQVGLWVYALLGFVGLPFGCAKAFELVAGKDGVPLGVALGFVLWVAGAIALRLVTSRQHQVRCALIEEGEASLLFPDPARIRPLLDLPKL